MTEYIGILVPKSFGGKDGKKALQEILSEENKPESKKGVAPVEDKYVTAQVSPPISYASKPTPEERFIKYFGRGVVVGGMGLLLAFGIFEMFKKEDYPNPPSQDPMTSQVDPTFRNRAWAVDDSYFKDSVRQNKLNYNETVRRNKLNGVAK